MRHAKVTGPEPTRWTKSYFYEFENALENDDFSYVAELAGISYDTGKKEHQCLIEEII